MYILGKDIAAQYHHNTRDVFNTMIDALVACDRENIPFCRSLEEIGLTMIDEKNPPSYDDLRLACCAALDLLLHIDDANADPDMVVHMLKKALGKTP